MTPYQSRMSPTIKRMVEDMLVRNYATTTIDAYTYHVHNFEKHFNKTVDQLGPEEIHQYQLHLVQVKKASWSSFNQAVCGLRFVYETTLGKPWTIKHIPFGKKPKTLPTVLGDDEVRRLLECVTVPKHRMTLLMCYAAGLRLSEASNLKVSDIDGSRGMIHIRCGKGRKDRLVPISPRLVEELREWWRRARPASYLFCGKTWAVPISGTTIQKACKIAVVKARIIKPKITPHTLRHSYATGMLEAGVDILTISKLLGHSSFITTMIYLHCRRPHFERSPSPIDWLPIRQCPKWIDPCQENTQPEPTNPPPSDLGSE
jgi:integrase/recombinase XerD